MGSWEPDGVRRDPRPSLQIPCLYPWVRGELTARRTSAAPCRTPVEAFTLIAYRHGGPLGIAGTVMIKAWRGSEAARTGAGEWGWA